MSQAPSHPVKAVANLSQDAFFGRTLHLVSRLRDHIQRLDQGVVYAVDDLAVVLRAFIHPGKGNDVLRRLRQKSGVHAPNVLLSAFPRNEGPEFSVGSIPLRHSGATSHGATHVSIDEWPNIPLIHVVADGSPKTYTWAAFLNVYANKWGGAHLDDAVPKHLQAIDYCASGGLNLSGYLLRAAAVEVWFIAQYLLSQWLIAASAQPAVDLENARLSAPGGISEDPSDTTDKGALQWFWWEDDKADFLWYVDPLSSGNAMRLQLGGRPWDVKYKPLNTPDPQRESPIFQSPRELTTTASPTDGSVTGSEVKVMGNILPFPNNPKSAT